ncbi:MAG: DUF2889 domain-containing protein [Desulfobacterales bacterium]|nr:DUF2889 domain-containing protein [Desulfobacterales bacterium]
MLRYMRKKIVSVDRRDQETLAVHGVLDDDIYSLELDLRFSIPDLEILTIEGKWNRWTTAECPRATPFLQEAAGFRVEPGLSRKVHKIIGRKGCRHYANLLLECCHSAREAAMIARWEDAKADDPDLTFETFVVTFVDTASDRRPPDRETAVKAPSPPVKPATPAPPVKPAAPAPGPAATPQTKASGGTVIDLHVHTYPASPCSSAAVDDLIVEAKRIGLDGICLTDHNHLWAPADVEALRQKHGFMVLRGNEITTNQGDVLVFGLERDIKGIINLQELRAEVVSAGGFMIVAHPIRGFLVIGAGQVGLTPEKAMEREVFGSVDAVEALNGKVTGDENAFASKVAASLGLPTTGGSDAHEVEEVGQYATRFAAVIHDEKDLIEALKSGAYSPEPFRGSGF